MRPCTAFAVFDYECQSPNGAQLNKLVFVNWAPDNARVKSKMMYASTKVCACETDL